MSAPFLPFARPDIGDAEIAAVTEALRSGWVTTGPKARAFEQAFTDYLGGSGLQSIAVNSATAGLHLALEALGIGPGDEVIAPTLTFTATVEVVRYLGADVRLVDVLDDTLNIDPAHCTVCGTPSRASPSATASAMVRLTTPSRSYTSGVASRSVVNPAVVATGFPDSVPA